MRLSTATCLAASVLSLLTAGALAMPPGGKVKKDSQVSLVQPEDAPDDNAKGTLRLREKGNKESLEIHVLQVSAGDEHHAWMEDPIASGSFSDIGTLSEGGSQQLKFDTKKGGALPLGADSLDDLIGRKVQIRHDADVILQGTVPPFGLSKKPQKASITIEATDDEPQPDMSAKLALRSKADKGQERIILKVKHIDWNGDGFHVFVEDGVGSDVFVDSGELQKTGDHEGRWKRDTKQGQALPAGASFVSELAGRHIELRRAADDVVFLSGTIPAVK
ncbi:MAG TPA: hypothetical protein VFY71_18135 [Planctomycetota bacterium]|nr:hypothetical protein [Planctomycetota bacterium]